MHRSWTDARKCMMYAPWTAAPKLMGTSEPVPSKDVFGVSACPRPLYSGLAGGVRNPADSRGPWPCWPMEGSWITPVQSVPPPAGKCDLTRTFRNMFPLHVSPFILPKLYCICQIFSWLRTSGYENWDFLLCSPSLSCFYSFGGHK